MTHTKANWPADVRIFVVGGWVRDRLLGVPSKDRDFVVVGATPQDMLNLGFKQVGADFPVFLHPTTGDEFALARTERKTGPGYKGFAVDASPEVTLEDDLRRRDLTINAMAMEVREIPADDSMAFTDHEVIDPFRGQKDLNDQILRHVSEAFAEDPVRVLRAARFRARFNFSIARSTVDLMKSMALDGELDNLVPERILAEFEKLLMEQHPHNLPLMVHVGLPVGCREAIFPHMTHDVVSNFELMVRPSLRRANLLSRWAVLFHNVTDHRMLDDLKVSKDTRAAIEDINTCVQAARNIAGSATQTHDFLMSMNAFQDDRRLFQLIDTLPLFNNVKLISNGDLLVKSWRAAKAITFASLTQEQQDELQGPDIKAAIVKKRIEVIDSFFS